jgi:hypothetical protein
MSAFRKESAREKEAREKAAQEDYDYACEWFGTEEALAGDDLVKVARVRAQFNAWKRNWRLDYGLDNNKKNDVHVISEEEKLWMEEKLEKLGIEREEAIYRYLEAPDTSLNDNAQFMRYMEPYRLPGEKTTEAWININNYITSSTKHYKRRLKVGDKVWSNIIDTFVIVCGISSSIIVELWLILPIICAFLGQNIATGYCQSCLLQRTKIKYSKVALLFSSTLWGLSAYSSIMFLVKIL